MEYLVKAGAKWQLWAILQKLLNNPGNGIFFYSINLIDYSIFVKNQNTKWQH